MFYLPLTVAAARPRIVTVGVVIVSDELKVSVIVLPVATGDGEADTDTKGNVGGVESTGWYCMQIKQPQ